MEKDQPPSLIRINWINEPDNQLNETDKMEMKHFSLANSIMAANERDHF